MVIVMMTTMVANLHSWCERQQWEGNAMNRHSTGSKLSTFMMIMIIIMKVMKTVMIMMVMAIMTV